MIVKSADGERYVGSPPKDLVAALLFGPDQGLVRERAERLAKTLVSDLRDPFRVADLDEATLLADPARLTDEFAALSMTGGRRVVRVRGAGNALTSLFDSFLENPVGEALVVVEGGDLTKGGLRKTFEDAPNAAAVGCYLDSAATISDLVRNALKEENTAIAGDALDAAVMLLGSDRGTTRREIEKLVLYARGSTHVSVDDVRAAMGDEAEARVEAVCDAAGEGDTAKLDREMERLWADDQSPVGMLRVAMGHFQRLSIAAGAVARGENLVAFFKRNRIHFSREASFRMQARSWSEERLSAALDLLLDAEALCKTTAVPAKAACGRAFFAVAALARLRT